MKLSVVIPVYKVEEYLDRCVESVLNQGITDCEVILVDDCSPDRCGEMCDRWAERDKRVRVLHCPENGGLSAARNRGIELACGEYVTFVDSDDFLAPDTYIPNIALLDSTPEAKALEFPVMVDYGSEHCYKLNFEHRVIHTEQWLEEEGYTHAYAWNKIYRRELFNEECNFAEGRLMEDLLTVPYVIYDTYMIMSPHGLYYYCSREGTISRTVSFKAAQDYHCAMHNLYEWAVYIELNRITQDRLYLLLLNAQITMLRFGEEPKISERKVHPYLWHDDTLNRSMRLKAWLCSKFGSKFCRYWAKLKTRLK